MKPKSIVNRLKIWMKSPDGRRFTARMNFVKQELLRVLARSGMLLFLILPISISQSRNTRLWIRFFTGWGQLTFGEKIKRCFLIAANIIIVTTLYMLVLAFVTFGFSALNSKLNIPLPDRASERLSWFSSLIELSKDMWASSIEKTQESVDAIALPKNWFSNLLESTNKTAIKYGTMIELILISFIPILLSVISAQNQRRQEKYEEKQEKIEQDRLLQNVVNRYFEQISEILVDRHETIHTQEDVRIRLLISRISLFNMNYPELGMKRKQEIVRFLSEMSSHSLVKETDGSSSLVILPEANLEDTDLSYLNLRGADLQRSRLNSANLSSADLSDAILSNTNLAAANLSKANLSSVRLHRSILWGTNLAKANLTGAQFSSTSLRILLGDCTKCSLSYSHKPSPSKTIIYLAKQNSRNENQLEIGNVAATNISFSSFRKAALTSAYMPASFIWWNDFEHSNLTAVDFRSSIISWNNFSHANLDCADFCGSLLRFNNFSEACLSHAKFNSTNFSSVLFPLMNTNKKVFEKAGIRWSDVKIIEDYEFSLKRSSQRHYSPAVSLLQRNVFSDAILTVADFRKSTIRYADFSSAKLQMADFSNALFPGNESYLFVEYDADFYRADLTQASFKAISGERSVGEERSSAPRINFRKAILDRVDFTEADLRGCKHLTAVQLKTTILCRTLLPKYLRGKVNADRDCYIVDSKMLLPSATL